MAEEISCHYNVELTGGEWKGMYIIKYQISEITLQEVSAKYWPNKVVGDEKMKVGPFTIETTSETEWDKYFVRRIMKVKMISGIKVICL